MIGKIKSFCIAKQVTQYPYFKITTAMARGSS